jgi:transcription elongation GreA/GreB family factor
MSRDTGSKKFVEQERARLESELADLKRRRDQLRSDLQGDAETVGDRGDAADALQRADDRAGVEEQIGRVAWLLAGGNTTVEGQLPNGTEVKLRFSDGEESTMRVVNYIEETPVGAEDTTLTADSPLGLALFGHKAGETISYLTPRGELEVTLLAIKTP